MADLSSPTDLLSPEDIEARARAAGITIADACKLAEIAFSTFYRWKTGKTNPSVEVYRRLCDATAPRQTA